MGTTIVVLPAKITFGRLNCARVIAAFPVREPNVSDTSFVLIILSFALGRLTVNPRLTALACIFVEVKKHLFHQINTILYDLLMQNCLKLYNKDNRKKQHTS